MGGCDKPSPGSPAPKVAAPGAAHLDPVLAQVDGEPLRLSWVRARLKLEPDDTADGRARALARAASDVICLREFGVLGERAKPGESPQQAVDRMLAGAWPSGKGCVVSDDELRQAYRQTLTRWRHPTELTLWEARYNCCPDGCPPQARSVCQENSAAQARALHQALKEALPPPLAVTLTSLDDTAARESHIPLFEGQVAKHASSPPWKLLRYTAFAREAPFERARFRRTDAALERAASALPIGGLTEPVPSVWGWSVAMVVARVPWSDRRSGDELVRATLRRELCIRQAEGAREAYRARMLSNASLQWRRALITAHLGQEVTARLPPPKPRPHLPKMSH